MYTTLEVIIKKSECIIQSRFIQNLFNKFTNTVSRNCGQSSRRLTKLQRIKIKCNDENFQNGIRIPPFFSSKVKQEHKYGNIILSLRKWVCFRNMTVGTENNMNWYTPEQATKFLQRTDWRSDCTRYQDTKPNERISQGTAGSP